MSSKPPQFGLYLTAAALLAGAIAVWNVRTQRIAPAEAAQPSDGKKIQRQTQRATALLYESFWADNHLKYSAVTHTTATYGGQPVTSAALITREPGALAIKFLSGPKRGLGSGYSERWFWRSTQAGGMTPYASVAIDATQMAARRFALMLDNYAARLDEAAAPQKIGGREVEVVELRPWQPVSGAGGPAKRLFIDHKTHLTLRVEAYNYRLQRVLHSELSDLDLAPRITPTTFEPPQQILAAARKESWLAEEMGNDFKSVAQKTGILPPVPAYVPPGFELDAYGIHRCPGSPVMAALTRYTDGINTLTLFALKPTSLAKGNAMPGACDFGPGSMASRADNGGYLVALADLPPQELQRVLKSAKVELKF